MPRAYKKEGWQQLRLLTQLPNEPIPKNGGFSFSDPAFASNKTTPVHRWVPWIAGFASNFVQDALSRHLDRKGVVLDPFAGVGTTLVDAIIEGHSAVGFEINPYAALACRTKLNAYRIDLMALTSQIARLYEFWKAEASTDYVPQSSPPKGFKTRDDFYSPKVLRKVLIIQDFINTIEETELRDLFRVAFASTMVRYSNYSYEPSLGRRVAAGKDKIEDFPVLQAVTGKLVDMADDIAWFQERLPHGLPDSRIIVDSFLRCENYLTPGSVDLIITSPPYLNNYHYNRNTRPQLYWLGLTSKPADLQSLETMNFGKFWQTVRNGDEVLLKVPSRNLERKLEILRAKSPERGQYGGAGWANYVATYFNDSDRFLSQAKRQLRIGGHAVIVVGNSIIQGIEFKVDQLMAELAEIEGFTVVDVRHVRSKRVGNSIIDSSVRNGRENGHKQRTQLYDAAVILRA